MTMHLQQGLSTINTRKSRKLPKMTKAKMAELEVSWRKHNKSMKQRHLHHMRYETLNEYIEYRFGLQPKKDIRADRTQYRPQKSYAQQRIEEFNEKYPSMPMKPTGDHNCGKKEVMKYTGDLIQGIATMHKSNAVPVMKGTDQAKDIARMRRG